MGNGDESKLDRELIELLNELRVVLPGVQVLFAFLLTVPFSQRFPQLSPFQRNLYFFVLLSAAAASFLLIAPSAHHRLRWRKHDKEQVLETANLLAIFGIVFLAIAMTAAVFLVTDVLFGTKTGAWVGGITAGVLTAVWFGFPMVRALQSNNGGKK